MIRPVGPKYFIHSVPRLEVPISSSKIQTSHLTEIVIKLHDDLAQRTEIFDLLHSQIAVPFFSGQMSNFLTK